MGQIPQGSTIQSAYLTLTTEGSYAESSTGAGLYRMLGTWSESDTWNSLVSGGTLNASGSADAITGALFAEESTRTFDVTSSVQAWANAPATNHGWAIITTQADQWRFRSTEWGEPAERPMLTVRFVPLSVWLIDWEIWSLPF